MNKGIGCESRTVTAAVCVGKISSSMKIGHWATGKANWFCRSVSFTKRESEDLRGCFILVMCVLHVTISTGIRLWQAFRFAAAFCLLYSALCGLYKTVCYAHGHCSCGGEVGPAYIMSFRVRHVSGRAFLTASAGKPYDGYFPLLPVIIVC